MVLCGRRVAFSSCNILSTNIHIISYHLIRYTYHIITCHIISFVTSSHSMSYHITWHNITYLKACVILEGQQPQLMLRPYHGCVQLRPLVAPVDVLFVPLLMLQWMGWKDVVIVVPVVWSAVVVFCCCSHVIQHVVWGGEGA